MKFFSTKCFSQLFSWISTLERFGFKIFICYLNDKDNLTCLWRTDPIKQILVVHACSLCSVVELNMIMKWCNLTLTYFLEIWEKIIHQKMYSINNCDWVEQFIRRTFENCKTDTECHQFLLFHSKQWVAHHSNAPIKNKLLHQDNKILMPFLSLFLLTFQAT